MGKFRIRVSLECFVEFKAESEGAATSEAERLEELFSSGGCDATVSTLDGTEDIDLIVIDATATVE